jgi:hypothetical protein
MVIPAAKTDTVASVADQKPERRDHGKPNSTEQAVRLNNNLPTETAKPVGMTGREKPAETNPAQAPYSASMKAADSAPVIAQTAIPAPVVIPSERTASTPAAPPPSESVREASGPAKPTGNEAVQSAQTTPVAENRETSQAAPTTAAFSRIKFTAEQIRELQAMVTKAVQSARISASGSQEATFNWNVENLGAIRFRIVSRQDDVRIEISSPRQDVVNALEDGKGVVERMITDVGLRVEKFDVRVTASGRDPEWTNQAHERGDRPSRQSETDTGFAGSGNGLSEGGSSDEPVVRRMPVGADHEWVA